jgi:hypothetical protein
MTMLELKFGAQLPSLLQVTLRTKPSFQFISSGNPATLWTEFYLWKSLYSLLKYLENHAPSHLLNPM